MIAMGGGKSNVNKFVTNKLIEGHPRRRSNDGKENHVEMGTVPSERLAACPHRSPGSCCSRSRAQELLARPLAHSLCGR